MFNIALFQPEIPPNTGNLIRLCANTGFALHLIHPLGFELEEKKLRRAGLDYRELAVVHEHDDYASFINALGPTRVFACTTKAENNYTAPSYQPGDTFLFGPETRGLPEDILQAAPGEGKIRIPMLRQSRSINLANAVSIIVFEAWRQNGFTGGT
ncbi:MAG: tRNA (cytidine(34)-2'-O)-methyltransferase [Gammaproteobacteria bacterium]|nr:tRNA (cytidine(34)-2'-O)-methyltransferase [Gammaproteobacteria bacterium]